MPTKAEKEDLLEVLFWEFDAERATKTRDERTLFKGKLRFYSSFCAEEKQQPTWTRADQEAGVSPPVGCKYLVGSDNRELECLYNDATGNVWGFDSEGAVSGYALGYCRPIETPEEKAQRLEDEFVASLLRKDSRGAQSRVNAGYIHGIIDAYRKIRAEGFNND